MSFHYVIILLITGFILILIINRLKQKMTIKKDVFTLKKDVIINNKDPLFFPDIGLTEFKIPIYTLFNSDMAKVYFRILNKSSLEYYVFAGSAIGMVRNRKNIPWVDDYDIIVFKDQIETYKTEVIPLLTKHGITTNIRFKNNDLLTSSAQIFDYSTSYFEIFTSYINWRGHVRSLNDHWGRYNKKGITMKMIKPAKYLEFDNMGFKIPFFNQWKKDIEVEYGNVIDKVDIHIGHTGGNVINSHFSKVYKEFQDIVNNAIFNTKRLIKNNQQHSHEYLNKLVIKNKNQFTDRIELLQYIYRNNIGKIFILSNSFVKFTYAVKYYFPNIQIILYIYKDFEEITAIMLNKIDIVRVSNNELLEKYTDGIIYVNKPVFELITIITFGTFDLLHCGHLNLFKKSRDICTTLIIGVSSDTFNEEKGKKSHENYEKRRNNLQKENIADLIFKEESFDKKQYYCDNYKANLLVMGDDWENRFDYLDIPTLYFPRTPGISSTQLRDKSKNIIQESRNKLLLNNNK